MMGGYNLGKTKRNVIITSLVIVCLLVGGWFGWRSYYHQHQSSTRPQTTRVVKKRVHLVAIGDSLTYGQGDEDKNVGYVGIIKPRLQKKFHNQVTTVNYGVSGDRSDQILDRIDQQATIRQHLHQADIIVMTVGGNDLMQSLQKNLTTNSTKSLNRDIDNAGDTYQKKLQRLFSTVRKQNKTAPIFVMSIYNPFYTYFPDVTIINKSINQWNQTTQDTMNNYKSMYFVNINKLMSYGQYQTKSQQQQLVKEEEKANQGQVSQKRVIEIMNHKDKNLNKYISTEDNFHPNHTGYVKIADQLFKIMQKHDSWEFTRR